MDVIVSFGAKVTAQALRAIASFIDLSPNLPGEVHVQPTMENTDTEIISIDSTIVIDDDLVGATDAVLNNPVKHDDVKVNSGKQKLLPIINNTKNKQTLKSPSVTTDGTYFPMNM
ncbi:hypothetical protein ACA910_014296 [Epithemia clementina (nom. ined.)]